MHAFAVGAALAARSLGYQRTASLIEAEQLDAEAVLRLFSVSASKDAWRDVSLILLAGSVSRYRSQPVGWSAEPERALVMALLQRHGGRWPDSLFDKLAARASAIVVARRPRQPQHLASD